MPRQTDSREKLLQTASEMIWRGSYSSTSVDDICEACGIKKGSFYHHFASKEELTTEALERGWQRWRAALDEAFSPLLTPVERIRKFLRADCVQQEKVRKGFGCVCGCPLFSLGTEIGTHEPKLRAKVEELLCRTSKYFEAAIREGHALGEMDAPDAKRAAWQVLTFWEGATTLGRIRNDLQPLRDADTAVLRILGVKETAGKN